MLAQACLGSAIRRFAASAFLAVTHESNDSFSLLLQRHPMTALASKPQTGSRNPPAETERLRLWVLPEMFTPAGAAAALLVTCQWNTQTLDSFRLRRIEYIHSSENTR
jgi:hypothetical protein